VSPSGGLVSAIGSRVELRVEDLRRVAIRKVSRFLSVFLSHVTFRAGGL
jgi:hypothetical protein